MKISDKKLEKVSEQILSLLYSISPKPLFTSHIASEIARDEEFVKKILLDLKRKNILQEIKKNSKGVTYLKRTRWMLSEATYRAYKQSQ